MLVSLTKTCVPLVKVEDTSKLETLPMLLRLTARKIDPDTMQALHAQNAFIVYWQKAGKYEVWVSALEVWKWVEPEGVPFPGQYNEYHYRLSGDTYLCYERWRNNTRLSLISKSAMAIRQRDSVRQKTAWQVRKGEYREGRVS